MSNTITLPIPGQIRRHVLKNLDPRTKGERDLKAACVDGAKELEANEMSPLNTVALHVTNDALGVALDIARDWLDSDNGNNVMAGKSMLKYELDYEPADPREIRHEIKMPKSLMGFFMGEYNYEPAKHKRESKVVRADLDRMSWTSTGAKGRVRAETLGWFLTKMDGLKENPHPATARAAKKFVDTFTEPYEQTQRLITGYLGIEDQEPAAIEEQRPSLVVIACGGKKSEAPGKIPAEERYTGNYFRACLMAAEVMDGPTMVLSAKYGLIPLSEEIENYDVRVGDKDSVRLGTVRKQVEALGLEGATVTVLGGEQYVKGARQIWPDAEAPLKGGIGQQLKQLAGIYQGEALEHQEPEEYQAGLLRDIPNLPSRGRTHEPVIWYGGKAGVAYYKPQGWRKVRVTYTGEGKYELSDLETREAVRTGNLRTQLYWAPVGPDEDQGSEPTTAEPEVKPAAKPRGGYEVPENWLELAEEGNTEAARRYWTRRCEEYRRTGQ
ncbi:DUF6884 domain-containing protein [Streptomyces sp. NPDC014622]|uniref:DUF6884 domain-containing protein n=1 Tax=Streptomyces sp. NPDC014622 TaxID=3364874 RepID=UPI0036F6DC7E